MINLEKEYLNEVKRILRKAAGDCEVRAFGSRLHPNTPKYSDLDLVLVGEKKIQERKIETLKDAFSESDLPIMVDVLDWHALSEPFKKVILEQSAVIQKGKSSVYKER